MPASKKDLKKAQQKQNVAKGIGDEKGRIPSRTKVKGRRITSSVETRSWSILGGGEVEKVGSNSSLVE